MLLKMPVGRSLLSTLGLERVDGLVWYGWTDDDWLAAALAE